MGESVKGYTSVIIIISGSELLAEPLCFQLEGWLWLFPGTKVNSQCLYSNIQQY